MIKMKKINTMPDGLLVWHRDGSDIVASSDEIEGLEKISDEKISDMMLQLLEKPDVADGYEKYGVRSAIIRNPVFSQPVSEDECSQRIMVARMVLNRVVCLAGGKQE